MIPRIRIVPAAISHQSRVPSKLAGVQALRAAPPAKPRPCYEPPKPRLWPLSLFDRLQNAVMFPPWERAKLREVRPWPSAFDVQALDIEIKMEDGTPLKGWWVPASTRPDEIAIVYTGLHTNRGFYLKDIKFLNKQLGCHVAIVDHRGIGGSAGKPEIGQIMRDARRIYDAVRNCELPVCFPNHADIILFGGSFGAALAIDVGLERPSKATITYGAFDSFRHMPMEHGIPLWQLALFPSQRQRQRERQRPLIPLWQRLLHLLFALFLSKRLENIDKIRCLQTKCLFLIHGLQDEQLRAASLANLRNAALAAGLPNECFVAPDAFHQNALHTLPEREARRLREFIDQHNPRA